MGSHIPCNNPHHALTSFKIHKLRSIFESGPKDTNTLGKAMFFGRVVGFNNHLWSMRGLM